MDSTCEDKTPEIYASKHNGRMALTFRDAVSSIGYRQLWYFYDFFVAMN